MSWDWVYCLGHTTPINELSGACLSDVRGVCKGLGITYGEGGLQNGRRRVGGHVKF